MFCVITAMSSKTRKAYTVQFKLKLIRQVEEQGNLDKNAKENGIDRRCLQRWKVKKSELLDIAQKQTGAKLKRLPQQRGSACGAYPEMEKMLIQYISGKREKG